MRKLNDARILAEVEDTVRLEASYKSEWLEQRMVDGDGRGAPAKKKAKTKKPRGAASRARDIAKNKYHNANT